MALACDDEDVYLFDLRNGEKAATFKGHLDFNFSTTFMEDYQFASGG